MKAGESRELFETRNYIVRIDKTSYKKFPYEIYVGNKADVRRSGVNGRYRTYSSAIKGSKELKKEMLAKND